MDGNLRAAAITWLCFFAGLFFCGIGCLADNTAFDRWLPASGGALIVLSYYTGFLTDCRRGEHDTTSLQS